MRVGAVGDSYFYASLGSAHRSTTRRWLAQRRIRSESRPVEEPAVEELKERLLAKSFPRLQMMLIVSLAGLGAFLCSVALLHSGLGSMAWRYLVAATFGYLLFLVLIRSWLAYQRRYWSLDSDVPTDVELNGESGSFSGEDGSFGGGGASGSFGPSGGSSIPHSDSLDIVPSPGFAPSAGFLDSVPDVDEAWPVARIALGLGALLAGLVALGFVVYASPVLFAEVLLDAAVVGAVYRRARRRSRGHWLGGVLRRTWLPAAGLCVLVALTGFVLQSAAPEARSLGAVFRAE